MPTLTIPTTYNDTEVLTEAQLDAIKNPVIAWANGTIASDNIAASGIAETNIANGAVTVNKLGTAAVTSTKIYDFNVTADKLSADAVTTVKILDSNVTTAKINDGAVTRAKLADAAEVVSGNVTPTFTTTSTSLVDITGSSTSSITVVSRPVLVILEPTGSASLLSSMTASSSTSTATTNIVFLRDSTVICSFFLGCVDSGTGTSISVPVSLTFVDDPGAGSYVYKAQVKVNNASTTFSIVNVRMFAVELG